MHNLQFLHVKDTSERATSECNYHYRKPIKTPHHPSQYNRNLMMVIITLKFNLKFPQWILVHHTAESLITLFRK